MNKSSLQLLEKVFASEIDGALSSSSRLYQTKSKLAKTLADEGYLVEVEETLGGRFPVKIKGYELTHLGRMAYCVEAEEL